MNAMKYIKEIVESMSQQEIKFYGDIIKVILKNKKPKVFCFYYQYDGKFIMIDKVNLKKFYNNLSI